jgi:hypothetical protein
MEWQQRSRQTLQRSRPREPKPKGGPEAKGLSMAEALATPFRAKRPARTQKCRCGATATVHHHWLGATYLRTYMRGVAQRDGLDPEAVRRELRWLLADERNLTAYCHRCHEAGDPVLGGGFRARDVPASARMFAAGLGAEWAERLRRAYVA